MAKIIYFIRQGETHPVDTEFPTTQSGLPVVNRTLNTDFAQNQIRRILNRFPAIAVTLTGTRKEGLNSLFTTLSLEHDERFQGWCA